jgi:hypothetical protein
VLQLVNTNTPIFGIFKKSRNIRCQFSTTTENGTQVILTPDPVNRTSSVGMPSVQQDAKINDEDIFLLLQLQHPMSWRTTRLIHKNQAFGRHKELSGIVWRQEKKWKILSTSTKVVCATICFAEIALLLPSEADIVYTEPNHYTNSISMYLFLLFKQCTLRIQKRTCTWRQWQTR